MGYYCSICKGTIQKRVYDYSIQNFKKALCRDHQAEIAASREKLIRINRKKKSTPEALALGEALADRGWDVWIEKWDGHKHIDVAIIKAKVNIEVDGIQHNTKDKQALADLKRTYHSFKKGYLTLRVPNCLVRDAESLEETADYIDGFLRENLQDEEEYDEDSA